MLTACIIVRNEGPVLDRCLSSIAPYIDDCCIVDSGSTDDTIEIARRFGARIKIDASLADSKGRMLDFSAARNRALEMVEEGWILSVDADEILSVSDQAEFGRLIADQALQAIELSILSRGVRWYLPRVFRKRPWSIWRERVHEWVEVSEPVCRSACATITNMPHKVGKESALARDLRLCEQSLIEDQNNLRTVFYYARALKMGRRYSDAIPQFLRYWRESNFQAGRYVAVNGAAICALLNQDFSSARRYAMAAYRLDSRLAEACCILGDVSLGVNRPDLAIGWFERALSKNPPVESYPLYIDESCYKSYPAERILWIKGQMSHFEK